MARRHESVIGPLVELGPQEREVARYLLEHCLPDKEIAARMQRAVRTVSRHLAEIRRKTGLQNRTEVHRWLSCYPGAVAGEAVPVVVHSMGCMCHTCRQKGTL